MSKALQIIIKKPLNLVKPGTLVMSRHGKSRYNEEKRFAGLTDTPLIEKGKLQAREAGKLLKLINFKPNIVFTTKLSRAFDTTNLMLYSMGIIPSNIDIRIEDALLERHYGALTGMNKEQVLKEFGPEKYLEYRRSYSIVPPAMDTTHSHHPDNNSPGDKVIGMPPNGLGTESLEHVVNRLQPFWENNLLPELQKGRDVLLVGHANNLRALNMIITGMTPEEVEKHEIDNGKPNLFDIISWHHSNTWNVLNQIELTHNRRA